VRWENPIDASTDSWAVAYAVTESNGAEIIAVDHDKDFVMITVNAETE
jgi:formaldehyde-activating enzyme involved in methanogenesis